MRQHVCRTLSNDSSFSVSGQDYSVTLDENIQRPELMKLLRSKFGELVNERTTTQQLKNHLKRVLKEKHPLVKVLSNLEGKLKVLCDNLKISGHKGEYQRMRFKLADFFFKTHPNAPLTEFQKVLARVNTGKSNGEPVKQKRSYASVPMC